MTFQKLIYFLFFSILTFLIVIYSNNLFSFKSILLKKYNALKKNSHLWLIFFAFFIRILFILNTDNSLVGDATARLYQAFTWANTNTISFSKLPFILNPNADWLPLHFYLMGSCISLFGDTIYSPRILSTLFGSLTIIPLYRLTRLLFNKQTAFIAVLLLSIYPAHIYISILTISESLYIFFAVTALYYCIRYLKNKDIYSLAFTVIPLALASLLRYEGWLLTIIITSALIVGKNKINSKKILLLILPFFSILFILTLLYVQGFNPLKGIIYSDFEISNYFNIIGRNYSSQINPIIFKSLIWGSIISFIYYVVNLKKQSTINKKYIFIISIVFGIYLYKILNFSLVSVTRYFVYYQVLLLPILSNLIYIIWENSKKRKKLIRFSILIILFTNLTSSYSTLFLKNGFKHPDGFWSTINFINSNITEGSFLIDQGNHNINHALMAHSKIFEDDKTQPLHSTYRESGEFWKEFRREEITKLDAALSISTYLILFKDGNLNKKFNLNKNENTYKNYSFTPKFQEGDLSIYEIKTIL